MAITCASAPALKPFFGKYLPDLTNRSHQTTKNSNAKRSFRQESSRDISNGNSEFVRNEQDTEGAAYVELVEPSKTTKAWDARSREFSNQTYPNGRTDEPGGVLKRVDVEVQYLKEEPHMNQISPSDRV